MEAILNTIIENFDPISLEEMTGVALMKRTDTKFIIHQNDLLAVLHKIRLDYRILEINEKRKLSYTSLYFDTPKNKFYNDHHNRKVNRTKIRMRKYMNTGICFLEIKQKDGKGKTTKTRTRIHDFEPSLSQNSQNFIQNTTQNNFELRPSIWNSFDRITLVSRTSKERLTIDLNLAFKADSSFKSFKNLAIIEVKQERFSRQSKIVQELKEKHINPYRISKYCIGMISIYHDLKYNRFKKKLIKINKIAS